MKTSERMYIELLEKRIEDLEFITEKIVELLGRLTEVVEQIKESEGK